MTMLPPGSAVPPAPHACPTCGRCPTCGSLLGAPVIAKPDHHLSVIAAIIAVLALIAGTTTSLVNHSPTSSIVIRPCPVYPSPQCPAPGTTSSTTTTAATTTTTGATTTTTSGSGTGQSWLIPAYAYPTSGTMWSTLETTVPAHLPAYVIADVTSTGPGTTVDPTYASAITAVEAEGWTVIGYDDTAYAADSSASVETRVDYWHSLYGVSDIFFDEVTGLTANLSYYETLTTYVHSLGGIDILNTGDVPDAGYLTTAADDAVVVMENTYSTFQSSPPPNYSSAPVGIGYILYSGPTGANLLSTLQAIKALGGNLVYVTDQPDTYTSLPSYFAAENADMASGGGGTTTTTGATTTTSGTTTTTAATTTTTPGGIPAVGGLYSLNQSSSSTWTLSVNPVTVGDTFLVGIRIVSSSVTVLSMSGGHSGSWVKLAGAYSSSTSSDTEIWEGVATATGAANLTVTLTSSAAGAMEAQEFGATMGVDGSAASTTSSGASSITTASLTPAGSGEVYFSLVGAGDVLTAGSTAGYTYEIPAFNYQALVFNSNVGAATSASLTQASSASYFTLSILMKVGTPPPPTTTTTAASTTTTTAATTTTASGGSGSYLTPPGDAATMPDSDFNHNISASGENWAVSGSSSSMVSGFIAAVAVYSGVHLNEYRPMYWVPSGQANVSMSGSFTGSGSGQSPSSVPIPSFAVAGSSSDQILDVYQLSSGYDYEYWLASHSSGWSASYGASNRYQASFATWSGIFTAPYSEAAPGIANIATIITEADVYSGAINHAIGITLDYSDCHGYVAPVTHGDCSGGSTGDAGEGQFFRFAASTNCASYTATSLENMVCLAGKTYGFVVLDSGGGLELETEQTSDWAAEGQSGTDPITAAGGSTDIPSLPWSTLLQAVVYP